MTDKQKKPINRRSFFRGAASLSVGSLGAGALLGPLRPNIARGADSEGEGSAAQLEAQTKRALR